MYNFILVEKLINIFKLSFEDAALKVSEGIKVRGLWTFINSLCKISGEDRDKIYSFVKKQHNFKRTFRNPKKSLPWPEIYKKNHYKKVSETCIERYGVDNVFKSEKFIKKIKQTKLERHGSENYVNIEKIKRTKLEKYGSTNYVNSEKMKQTKLEKYGDENYNNLDKIKQTNIERYGVENVFELEFFQKNAEETKIKKYGNKNYNNFEKTKRTNKDRYGVESYTQTDEYKQKCRNTNNSKYKRNSSTQVHFKNFENLNEDFVKKNFIKDSRFLIDEFSEFFNIINRTTSLRYKKIFNISEPNKSNYLKTQQYIFDSIDTENKIFNDRHLGLELDIFIPDYNLAIEYDGLMFHSEGNSKYNMFNNTEKSYHLKKTELCLKNNIQVFHIFEGEDLDLWLSMINTKLNLNKKIYARKCIIKELKSQETKEFLEYNHIQGYISSKVNLGLYFEDELVSVMTFSKPRFNKNYEYELIRFCSKRNTSVIGGASKLWKYFVTKYNPKSVISYANRRFSNGEIYKTLGFTFLEKTSPNYFYFKEREHELFSRVKFQKHKLKDILDIYDENLSEAENMFNNGYRRIFDCGNLKFEYKK